MPASWKGLLGRRLRLVDLGRTRLVCRAQESIGAFVRSPMRAYFSFVLCYFSVFPDDFLVLVISLSPKPSNILPINRQHSPYKPSIHTSPIFCATAAARISPTSASPNSTPTSHRPYSPSRVCVLRPGARRRRMVCGEDCTWEECGEQAFGVEEAWDDMKPGCWILGVVGLAVSRCGSVEVVEFGECDLCIFLFSRWCKILDRK